MNILIKISAFVLVVGFLVGCSSYNYQPIADVPEAVNMLGQLIGQEQANVVPSGGTEFNPGFSTNDRINFENSNRLEQIVSSVTQSNTFKEGVAAIRSLSEETRQMVYTRYRTPIYPTWAMNGVISSAGTTDAGYAVESQIASALTRAVIEAVEANE